MTDYSQLPEWTCHKVVHAAKIVSVDLAGRADAPQNTVVVVVVYQDGDTCGVELDVPYEVTARKAPSPGDYLVAYNVGTPDEYISWSPAAVFEDGYSAGRRG